MGVVWFFLPEEDKVIITPAGLVAKVEPGDQVQERPHEPKHQTKVVCRAPVETQRRWITHDRQALDYLIQDEDIQQLGDFLTLRPDLNARLFRVRAAELPARPFEKHAYQAWISEFDQLYLSLKENDVEAAVQALSLLDDSATLRWRMTRSHPYSYMSFASLLVRANHTLSHSTLRAFLPYLEMDTQTLVMAVQRDLDDALVLLLIESFGDLPEVIVNNKRMSLAHYAALKGRYALMRSLFNVYQPGEQDFWQNSGLELLLGKYISDGKAAPELLRALYWLAQRGESLRLVGLASGTYQILGVEGEDFALSRLPSGISFEVLASSGQAREMPLPLKQAYLSYRDWQACQPKRLRLPAKGRDEAWLHIRQMQEAYPEREALLSALFAEDPILLELFLEGFDSPEKSMSEALLANVQLLGQEEDLDALLALGGALVEQSEQARWVLFLSNQFGNSVWKRALEYGLSMPKEMLAFVDEEQLASLVETGLTNVDQSWIVYAIELDKLGLVWPLFQIVEQGDVGVRRQDGLDLLLNRVLLRGYASQGEQALLQYLVVNTDLRGSHFRRLKRLALEQSVVFEALGIAHGQWMQDYTVNEYLF